MCQCALFLLQNLCYNFQALMPFKLLAVIWPGGQSAGRQESGGGGWEAPWHQSPLPACSSAQPGTGTAGTGVNTLLSGGSPAPHQRGTRSWQVFYPEPFSPGILVKHLSTLQRTNSTNRERERANRAADISQRSKLVNPIRIKTQKAK